MMTTPGTPAARSDTAPDQVHDPSTNNNPNGANDPNGADNAPAGTDRMGLRPVILSLVWDVGLSIGAYYLCRALGASTYVSLLVGTLVAGVRVAYVAIRARHFDAFAGFMVGVFGIGLILSFLSGDDRFLLLKDSFGTAAAGLAFLGSCVIGRPLIYYAAQRFAAPTPQGREQWEALWATSAPFRRTFVVLSAVWGIGLLVEAAVRVVLVYVLPVDVMAGLSSVLSIAAFALLMTWNMWYSRRAQARGRARAAAAAEAAPAA
ncbi:intracellular septation protein A [Actinopolymorpha pittospori]|uniref:Intracellular septation protein A n=2 Tax=Actinopolymorpha pittospori TaxID=648752 RepID=A0A927RCK7_9ACTN|nr:VC0807 family protein [Actinopolymorpha pittospori]MBE1611372.1 intracellular septation protein A [Actinopolymorpha pittospori]